MGDLQLRQFMPRYIISTGRIYPDSGRMCFMMQDGFRLADNVLKKDGRMQACIRPEGVTVGLYFFPSLVGAFEYFKVCGCGYTITHFGYFAHSTCG